MASTWSPCVFGTGVPYFGNYTGRQQFMLDDPLVIEGDRVTHLQYRVAR